MKLGLPTARFRHSLIVIVAVLSFSLVLQASAVTNACNPGALKFLTGKRDGFYFTLGQAIQTVAAAHRPEYQLNICAQEVDPALGTIGSIAALDSGQAAFALVQSDVAHDGWYGHPTFERARHTHLVLPLFVEAIHILLRPHLNISRVGELKGRKVWLGPKNSGTEYTARRVLWAVGLNPDKDVEAIHIAEFDEGAKMLQQYQLDALFRVTVVSSAQLQDILGTDSEKRSEVRLLDLDYELADRLAADGSYIETLIPARYGQNRSTLTVGVQAFLLSGKDVGDKDVTNLAELIRLYREEIETEVNKTQKDKHANHDHPDITLSLLNVPTSAGLYRFIYPEQVKGYLYNRWRDSLKPLLPLIFILLVAIVGLVVWKRTVFIRALLWRPHVSLLVVGTLAIWLITSAVLYHVEWSVNEHFNSFPRSMRFVFLYLISYPGYSPLTPDGDRYAEIAKWLSVLLLGGFATPLFKDLWRGLSDRFLKEQPGRDRPIIPIPVSRKQSQMTNRDVAEMIKHDLTPEIVIRNINMSECAFDTSHEKLIELKASGVPNEVVIAMLDASQNRSTATRVSA